MHNPELNQDVQEILCVLQASTNGPHHPDGKEGEVVHLWDVLWSVVRSVARQVGGKNGDETEAGLDEELDPDDAVQDDVVDEGPLSHAGHATVEVGNLFAVPKHCSQGKLIPCPSIHLLKG